MRWEALRPLATEGRKVLCKDAHGPGCRDCVTCHFCRQKTIARKTYCACYGARRAVDGGRLRGSWCGDCLASRMGESLDEVLAAQARAARTGRAADQWRCPACREICNCSGAACQRARAYLEPTSVLTHEAHALGYRSAAHYLILTHLHTSRIVPPMIDVSSILPRRPAGAGAGGAGAGGVMAGPSAAAAEAAAAAASLRRGRRAREAARRDAAAQLDGVLRAMPLPSLDMFSDLEGRGLGCGILDLDDAFDAAADDDEDGAGDQGGGGGGGGALGGGLHGGGDGAFAPRAAAAPRGGGGGGIGGGGGARGAPRQRTAATAAAPALGPLAAAGGGAAPDADVPLSPGAQPGPPGAVGGEAAFEVECVALGPEDALLPEEAGALAAAATAAAVAGMSQGPAVTQPPPPTQQQQRGRQQQDDAGCAKEGGATTPMSGAARQQQQQQQQQQWERAATEAARVNAADFPSADAPGYAADDDTAAPRPRVPRWLRDTSLGRRAERGMAAADATAAAAAAATQLARAGAGARRGPRGRDWVDGGAASPPKRARTDAASAGGGGGGRQGPQPMVIDLAAGEASEPEAGPAPSEGPVVPPSPADQDQQPQQHEQQHQEEPPAPVVPWEPQEEEGDAAAAAAAPGAGATAGLAAALPHTHAGAAGSGAGDSGGSGSGGSGSGGGGGVYTACLEDVDALLAPATAGGAGAAPAPAPAARAAAAALLQRCLDLYFQWDEARAVVAASTAATAAAAGGADGGAAPGAPPPLRFEGREFAFTQGELQAAVELLLRMADHLPLQVVRVDVAALLTGHQPFLDFAASGAPARAALLRGALELLAALAARAGPGGAPARAVAGRVVGMVGALVEEHEAVTRLKGSPQDFSRVRNAGGRRAPALAWL